MNKIWGWMIVISIFSALFIDINALITTPSAEPYQQIQGLTEKAFEMSKFAITLALGLVGLMGLWLGLMRIAEKSGLIDKLVVLINPLLRFLFPDIPKNHQVLGTISLNLSANVLGLGNAATPLGIRAMQQLQDINKHKDSASNAMCMFLALNTSSVQLLPPVTLIAIMGVGVQHLIVPIILATTCSTLAAFFAARLFARFYPQQGDKA